MDYGFTLPEGIDTLFYENFKSNYENIRKKRSRRWSTVNLKNYSSNSSKLRRFIRKGVPPELRETVWMKFSGADQRLTNNPNVYNNLLQQELDPCIKHVILADINRTYVDNIHFQQIVHKNPDNNSLQNILTAFAIHNPAIGYCQGLNYIASLIILVVSTEEKCFWLFDTIITKIVAGYYHPEMKSVIIDCLVLEELLRLKVHKVFKSFKMFDTNCIAMCTKWFVCLFVDVLPIETAMRVIDCVIYEGEKVLFRVALSLIKMNMESFIAANTFPEFAICFQNIVCNKSALQCHQFMQKVFKLSNPLSQRRIDKLRTKCETNLSSLNFIT